LIESLNDPDSKVQLSAIYKLASLRRAADKVIPILKRKLQDKKDPSRYSVLLKLEEFGAPAKSAIPEILEALTDEDRMIRMGACYALMAIKGGEVVVAGLISALNDQDDKVRSLAAVALGGYGPGAKKAIPALTKALNDRDEAVRKAAANSLGMIRGKSRGG
jgi:HEAT repeat protein